jgi:capsular polysaccharide transport system permease protein
MTIDLKKITEFLKTNRKKIGSNTQVTILGFLAFILIYLAFIQSDRYLSVAKVIVNQSRPMESNANDFSSFASGSRTKSEDVQLIMEYIKSIEMMEYLDYSIDLRKIYSNKSADLFSKLSKGADKDALYEFYLNHVNVHTSPDNSILVIEVQSFRTEDSRKILEIIIRRSEEFINKIFHDVAKEQLDFIKNEVLAKEKRILELEKKLRAEQRKAVSADSKIETSSTQRKVDFAIQAHKESLESLEKTRAESAQNLKKLVVITGPTIEQDATYPKRTYNLILFLSIFGLVYYIISSTYKTIITHRSMR